MKRFSLGLALGFLAGAALSALASDLLWLVDGQPQGQGYLVVDYETDRAILDTEQVGFCDGFNRR